MLRRWSRHGVQTGVASPSPFLAPVWLLHLFLGKTLTVCQNQLSGLLPGQLQYLLIGLHLPSKPSACCHHCSQINLFNTQTCTFPPSLQKHQWPCGGPRLVLLELWLEATFLVGPAAPSFPTFPTRDILSLEYDPHPPNHTHSPCPLRYCCTSWGYFHG